MLCIADANQQPQLTAQEAMPVQVPIYMSVVMPNAQGAEAADTTEAVVVQNGVKSPEGHSSNVTTVANTIASALRDACIRGMGEQCSCVHC